MKYYIDYMSQHQQYMIDVFDYFINERKEKELVEFCESIFDIKTNDEETIEGVAFIICEFLRHKPLLSKKIFDDFSKDSKKVPFLLNLLTRCDYSFRPCLWSLVAKASSVMHEKLKNEFDQTDQWKLDVNVDLGDLGF